MPEVRAPLDLPAPGAIARLDVGADNPDTWAGRLRTGPLGLQIAPLRQARVPFFFTGARLRGTRCIWSAATVSGAQLLRAARIAGAPFEGGIHLLARIPSDGSVFDPPPAPSAGGTLHVLDAADEVIEQFAVNTHLFTLNIPPAAIGMDVAAVAAMRGRPVELSGLQVAVVRGGVGLLRGQGDELATASSLVGVDRYLAAMAALLLRTATTRADADGAAAEQLRQRADSVIYEQATDPELTPSVVAAQLTVSLRQLYRAYTGHETPAARIRRRRLERAAEVLTATTGQVERIAAECGFASAEYFSRAFRREFGLSPRAYRATYRADSR